MSAGWWWLKARIHFKCVFKDEGTLYEVVENSLFKFRMWFSVGTTRFVNRKVEIRPENSTGRGQEVHLINLRLFCIGWWCCWWWSVKRQHQTLPNYVSPPLQTAKEEAILILLWSGCCSQVDPPSRCFLFLFVSCPRTTTPPPPSTRTDK